MASASTVALTGNNTIDALLSGMRWDTTALTYGFPVAGSDWTGYAAGSEPFDRFQALTAAQQSAVTAALSTWASVANITFTQVAEPGQVADLRYAGTGQTNTAHTYYPHSSPLGGDSWYGPRLTGAATWQPGSYEFETAVHETGHALGLKHPHDDSIGGAVAGDNESVERSVMSYRSYAGAPLSDTYTVAPGSYPAGPMLDDIAAIQYLYGANYTTNAGDTVYRFTPDQGVIFNTIWDGGGSDTYDLSAYSSGVSVNLTPGQWSTFASNQLAQLKLDDPSVRAAGNVANAFLFNGDPRSLIENAIGGSGNDMLTGNDANNMLTGSQGADTLFGNQGADELFGGCGPDILSGGSGGDIFVEGLGPDTIRDFNFAEGDRIQLGTGSYTVSNGATGAIVNLDGGSVTLDGIAAGSVMRDWFILPGNV
ncbi:MAG TPA: M10 family metallopeptidase [Azospirillum sp.]|nr:M10 family metallopeptidase [Azospirillum sp.]